MACANNLSTKDLPVENCHWLMGKVSDIPEFEDDEEGVPDEHCMLMIMDDKGAIIATDLCRDKSESIEARAISLLKDAMLKPMTYKPRRPKFILFRDMEPLKESVLQELGVSSNQETIGCKDVWDELTCSVCRRSGSKELFDQCGTCHAVHYCSNQCRDRDAKGSHQFWCSKMVQYMENSETLAQSPFLFQKETSSENFDHPAYKEFLQRKGVFGLGFWVRELSCMTGRTLPLFGDLEQIENNMAVVDEAQGVIRGTCMNTAPIKPLTGWEEYYRWRNFDMESPLAILMSFPMTVYYIITTLFIRDYPTVSIFSEGMKFIIHLIGAEKEADFIPLFTEIGVLMPTINLEIVMVGNELSKKTHEKVTILQNVKFTILKGCYHSLKPNKPNIVIGLNAGLGAYPTWGDTLKYLKKEDIPAYFTDYCAYSCECAKGPMVGLKLGMISDPVINPFRSPVRKFCSEQRMPWYSNAFIYRLLYGEKYSDDAPPSHTQPLAGDMDKCYMQ